MMIIISCLIAGVISYLLGSCNFAIIIVRLLKGEDIRKFGSGNAGLTNTLRCFGKGCAVLTLIGDLSKGVVAVLLSRWICSLMNAGINGGDTHYIGYVAGFFAIIGHIFPIYYGFKGGKGVLVGVSIFIVTDPPTFGILILIFIIVLSISKYVSLSSIISALSAPFVTFSVHCFIHHTDMKISLLYAVLSLLMASVIIYMHKSNIERLRNGTENRFSLGSKK
ncbi:MAG: glycerol-3-phosphate 1-O-acyltransferase PlsY [Oscillospiraceae bacterium]|nr:glycerol-3-phosphate 1-O-acyltransferase PlsY [Oscillospiraceae bacterium]